MLLVLLETPSPRARYVVHHVFERMLGVPVGWAKDLEEFRSASCARLNYGMHAIPGAYHMPWTGGIDAPRLSEPPVGEHEGLPALFPTPTGQDLFAGIFHLLSLADEVHRTERDEHGRVPSAALFTVRKGLADRPWVDQAALRLGAELERRWPGEVQCQGSYSSVATVDMDNILRYAGRPFHRAIGASAKDLLKTSLSTVVERWRVRAGRRQDPFVRAIELIEAQRHHFQRVIMFFLMRGQGAFIDASDPNHPATIALIQRAARVGEIGIHPSYGTSLDDGLHVQERTLLQRTINRNVRSSRQHFLRWRLPETLRFLSGYEHPEDHSLGFTDRTGFRAGTCTPFPWYDLERERETALMLWPFAAMDSALIERMGQSPAEVVRSMNAMSDVVRAVRGTFVSVWHDRYLSGHREFAPWPSVFEQVAAHAQP